MASALITDNVPVGGVPGAPTTGAPPQPGHLVPVRADLRQQYVAGGTSYSWYSNQLRSLPWSIDDLTRDFGPDLYERMLFDATVFAAVTVLKSAILEDGVHLAPAVDDSADPQYELACTIHAEAERMLGNLATDLNDVLWDLLDGICYGNRVAEQTYDDATSSTGKRLLNLTALVVKPRRSVAFVVDSYVHVAGMLALIPGQAVPVNAGSLILNPELTPNLLPREKFAVFTFRPTNNDPRGTSILRAAYEPWWNKQQIRPEYLKYLAQFAGPSLLGKTAPGANLMPLDDALGNDSGAAPTSPESALLTALLNWRNASALAVPAGTEVDVFFSQGEGDAFRAAWDLFSREITLAILTQTLATQEGQHQARAASEVHQDAQDTLIRQIKHAVVRLISHDVLRPWIRYNWGDAAAAMLVPLVSLGQTEEHDFDAEAEAIAKLQASGYLHPSQYAELDQRLGLPARDLSQDAVPAEALEPQKPAGTEEAAA